MNLKIKRIYEPRAKSDGTRILVDRLWPRGMKKSEVKIDLWLKELTPSNDLRQWYHVDKEQRYTEFKKKYHQELLRQKKNLKNLLPKGSLTLISAVKDVEHSHIPVLKKFLEKYA